MDHALINHTLQHIGYGKASNRANVWLYTTEAPHIIHTVSHMNRTQIYSYVKPSFEPFKTYNRVLTRTKVGIYFAVHMQIQYCLGCVTGPSTEFTSIVRPTGSQHYIP